MRFAFRLTALFLLFCAAAPAMAVKIERIEIKGLDEAMSKNVRASLSLEDSVGKVVSGRRMAYLIRVAEDETREALEPFGYYSPSLTIQRSDRREPERDIHEKVSEPQPDDAEGNRQRSVSIVITIDKGQPVKVRNQNLGIEGEGSRDRYLAEDLKTFTPQVGAVLSHPQYEASKSRITRRLTERGYFDADFVAHRVEVTRAERIADIDLRWNSGDRYHMGAIEFVQQPNQIIRPSLFSKLVRWDQGEYYHQGYLDDLRGSLLKLDYFSAIDIEPQPDQAVAMQEQDGSTSRRVPVKVTLTPAKRSIYSTGVSYGTDSGAGVSFGVERRYVNSRGHKALGKLDWAQNRKTATLQYRVPAFAWLDGWYTGSLQFADEQTDYIDTRRLELVGSRSGQYSEHLNLVASLHALRERWAYEFENATDPNAPRVYRYANYLFPSLRAEYADVDDRFAPRRGIGGFAMIRGGSGQSDDSDSNALFAQAHARMSWFKGLGPNDRLIVRGELGHTFTDALADLPPSLRFYAGGDRSIRGYQWREVGPRVRKPNGDTAFALGAKNVLTASVEYERYFNDSPWGAAVFVDTGDAFDGSRPDLKTGVGAGARWKSPVGPIRVDIARGLDEPDSPFTLHLNIGADF